MKAAGETCAVPAPEAASVSRGDAPTSPGPMEHLAALDELAGELEFALIAAVGRVLEAPRAMAGPPSGSPEPR